MDLKNVLSEVKDFDVNSIDFSDAKNWPSPLKYVAATVVMAASFAAGYFFLVNDKFSDIDREIRVEKKNMEEFKEKAYQVANLDDYIVQMEQMNEDFGQLVRQLPSDTEVPGLLEDITSAALESNLMLTKIDLQEEQIRDFYIELPIDIVVSGTYHNIGSFVSRVAGMPRIVTLHDFKLQPNDEANPDELQLQILAKTYRYREDNAL